MLKVSTILALFMLVSTAPTYAETAIPDDPTEPIPTPEAHEHFDMQEIYENPEFKIYN